MYLNLNLEFESGCERQSQERQTDGGDTEEIWNLNLGMLDATFICFGRGIMVILLRIFC